MELEGELPKIALDARAAGNEITGVGKYIIRLAEGLKARGVKTVLLYHQEPKRPVGGIEKRIIPGNNRFFWEQIRLPKFLNQNKFDLYHATWNYGIPLLFNGKSVLTLNDVIPLMWPKYFCGRNIVNLPEYLISLLISFKKANKIIAISQTTANNAIKIFPPIRKKTAVIHDGLDSPSWDKKRRLHEKAYLVYFGGVDKRKNITGLIKAYHQSKAKETYDLVIVGKHSDQFSGIINKLQLENKVRLVGYVSEEEKYHWLGCAVALVYPSFYEGFGIPPLEAMSVGTPVICSNISCLPEIVGEAALLINPYNIAEITKAIDQITEDKDLQQTLKIKGLEQVKKYSWDKMVEETIKVYYEINF